MIKPPYNSLYPGDRTVRITASQRIPVTGGLCQNMDSNTVESKDDELSEKEDDEETGKFDKISSVALDLLDLV